MIDPKTTTTPEKWITVITGATLAAYGLTRARLRLAIAGSAARWWPI